MADAIFPLQTEDFLKSLIISEKSIPIYSNKIIHYVLKRPGKNSEIGLSAKLFNEKLNLRPA